MAQDSHTSRTIRGANWNMLRVMLQTFVSLGTTIVVARILPPEDFGLLATAMIFIGFAEIISSMGMGSAIVQRKDLNEDAIRIANTLAVIIGLFLVVVLILVAYPVAYFFDDARVAPLVQVLSLGLFVAAISTVSRGLIMRRLDFKRLFFIDSIGHVIGNASVVIVLAVMGYGVWSMVLGTIASTTLGTLLSFYYEPFKMTLKPNKEVAKQLLSFGGGMSVSSLIGYFARNVDFFVIGKFLDQTVLGFYSRAYHLVNLPLTKIAGTLTTVMFSSYSEVQDDLERLRQVYYRVLGITAIATFPVFVGMLVSGEYIITGLYGENWAGAVIAFQILCLMGLIRLVLVLTGPVLQAAGYVHQEMNRQIAFFLLLIVMTLGGVQYGIEGVGAAVVGATLWLYVSMAQLLMKVLETNWVSFLRVQMPGYCLAIFVGVIDWLALQVLSNVDIWAELGLLIMLMVSGFAYMIGFLFLPRSIMGDTPAWLVEKMSPKLPHKVSDWLQHRFTTESV